MGLKEAKTLVDEAPRRLRKGYRLKRKTKQLEEAGAAADLSRIINFLVEALSSSVFLGTNVGDLSGLYLHREEKNQKGVR